MRRLLVVILPILAVLAACSSAELDPRLDLRPGALGHAGPRPAARRARRRPRAARRRLRRPLRRRLRRPRRPSAPSSAASAPAPSSGASGAPGASGTVLTVTAPVGAATAGYDEKTLSATANTPFTIHFDNQDNQAPHNVALKDSGGTMVALGGDITFFTGPGTRDLQVPALKTGTYTYFCQVHPSTMIGTLTVQ